MKKSNSFIQKIDEAIRDIENKNGKHYNESHCISVCLRTPRLISDSDADYLGNIINGSIHSIEKLNNLIPIDPKHALDIQFKCKSESEIEFYLVEHFDIFNNLKNPQRQVRLPDGNRIDILAINNKNQSVVIEIKKGIADDGTLAQLISYIHIVKKTGIGTDPQGILVCAGVSPRLLNATKELNIKIMFYNEIAQ